MGIEKITSLVIKHVSFLSCVLSLMPSAVRAEAVVFAPRAGQDGEGASFASVEGRKPSNQCLRDLAFGGQNNTTVTPKAASYRQLMPVNFLPGDGNALVSLTDGAGNVLVKHCGEANILEQSNSNLALTRGELVIAAKKSVRVNLGGCTVSMKPGTIALIERARSFVKVRVLYDEASSSTGLSWQDQNFKLSAGNELVIGTNLDTVRQAMSADGVGRRRLSYFPMADDHAMARCETSLVSVMGRSKLIGTILRSSGKDDRQISAKLIKMAAAILTATARHGSYMAI